MMLLGSWPQILYFDSMCVKPQGLCSLGQLGAIPISVNYVSEKPGFWRPAPFCNPSLKWAVSAKFQAWDQMKGIAYLGYEESERYSRVVHVIHHKLAYS